MTIENAIRAAALEMAKEHGLNLNPLFVLAMTEGARLMQIDLLSVKTQYVCSDCGKCGEAP